MSYWDISQMAHDQQLASRITAAAASENVEDPAGWVAARAYDFAAQPGWDAAWASAVAAGNPEPGRDEAVITDGMILSAVQAEVASESSGGD